MIAAVGILGAGWRVFSQEELPERTFRAQANVVLAPVTVLTSSGGYVNGLELRDFRLYDNEKLQDIRLDVTYSPLSMVVAIQRNNRTEAMLPNIKKMGNMLQALVIGEHGEAALLAFDHRMDVIQDFTNDGALFTKALEKLTPGSSNSTVVDAVFEGIRLLRRRPPDRRRVLVLISETKDRGSEGNIRDALLEAEVHNVIIYTINMDRMITALTTKAPAPRRDPFPTAAHPAPGPGPATPHTVAQLRGGQSMHFEPIFMEIFNQVKAIFISNHAEILTQYTGGREYSFTNLKSLERAVTDLGEELHSQYILSYTPDTVSEGGFHKIRVEVNRPGVEIRARRGYWMASRVQAN
ncbi:MAG: VWA domain-containing protein [Bryobacteraceae bacterium]|nr:VWA domain-containing protein [Bryobacteraceae bacterium]